MPPTAPIKFTQFQRILLWASVIGLIPLPALSNTGYLPFRAEYLFAALLSLLLAMLCAWGARRRYLGYFLLLSLTVFTYALYFGNILSRSASSAALTLVVVIVYVFLAFRYFYDTLMLAAVVSLVQILTAIALTPSFATTLKEHPVARSNLFSVVHILLDEHAGMAAIPAGAGDPDKVRRFEN